MVYHIHGLNDPKALCRYHKLKGEVEVNNKTVKELVKLEKSTWIDQKADLLLKAFLDNDVSNTYGHLGEIVAFSKKKNDGDKVTRVYNDSGELTQTYAEEKEAFREHFLQLMRGEVHTFTDVVARDEQPAESRFDSVVVSEMWKAIPSPSDVVCMFKTCKHTKKAPGENCISAFVHKTFYDSLMKLYYPLIMKSFVRIQPPIQWKGGMLQELFKGKGSSMIRNGYRDIVLANDDGKDVSRHIRGSMFPRAREIVLATQFGGGSMGVKQLLRTCM